MPTDATNGNDGGGGGNPIERLYELLGFIRARSFTANPPQVRPFEPTTISWECSLPSALHGTVTLVVAGHAVTGPSPGTGTLSGSTSVTLDRTAAFGINAKYGPPDDPVVSRGVVGALLTVTVSESECRSFPNFGPLLVTTPIRETINTALQGRLRPGGSTVTPSDVNGILSIAIPLNLDGQGKMDISMELWVQVEDPQHTGAVVAVTVHNLKVDVSLDGLASVCEGAVTQVAEAFMKEIADNQVASELEKQLNDRVQQLATSAQQEDPLHRVFTLTSLVLTSDSFTFTVCPVPPA
jgi:hypothetical protein